MIMADVDEKRHTATVSVYALDDLVAEVNKIGHWKSTIDGKPICSECGFVSESEDGYFVSHYCPNCGARMERSDKE